MKHSNDSAPPSHADIETRAYEIWLREGRPSGAAERHWLKAQDELHAAAGSRNLLHKVEEHAGSVQAEPANAPPANQPRSK